MPSLLVQEVDFTTTLGSKLAIENNILYPPAVFLEGKMIAKGKIDVDNLIATIRETKAKHY
jgi:alkyl hydroperoxide reductase subunit AhpF